MVELPPVPNWLHWVSLILGALGALGVIITPLYWFWTKIWRPVWHKGRPGRQESKAFSLIRSVRWARWARIDPMPRFARSFVMLIPILMVIVGGIIAVGIQSVSFECENGLCSSVSPSFDPEESTSIGTAVVVVTYFTIIFFVPLEVILIQMAPLMLSYRGERRRIVRAINLLANAKVISKTAALKIVRERLAEPWRRVSRRAR